MASPYIGTRGLRSSTAQHSGDRLAVYVVGKRVIADQRIEIAMVQRYVKSLFTRAEKPASSLSTAHSRRLFLKLDADLLLPVEAECSVVGETSPRSSFNGIEIRESQVYWCERVPTQLGSKDALPTCSTASQWHLSDTLQCTGQ